MPLQGSRPSRLFECGAWSPLQRSFLLSVSQLRSHQSIELLQKKLKLLLKPGSHFTEIGCLGGINYPYKAINGDYQCMHVTCIRNCHAIPC